MATDTPEIRGELRGAYLKLRRAEKHLHCLWDELATYDPNLSVGYQLDPESPSRMVPILVESTPTEYGWGIIIGDAIHNLRSVVEYVAYELHRHYAPTSTEKTQFPIYTCRKDYDGALKPRKRKGGGVKLPANQWILELPQQGQAFFRGLQPYHRSDPALDPLAFLASLSNRDKHRTLNPTVFITPPTTLISDFPGAEPATVEINPLKGRADVRPADTPGYPQMRVKDGAPFYVVLEPEKQPMNL